MIKIDDAKEKFNVLLNEQLERVKKLEEQEEFLDFSKLSSIIIGVCEGDGIGPFIVRAAKNVLELLLKKEIKEGQVILKDILGLTIQNRAKCKKSVPDEVLKEIKKCHVLLKGPTTTPRQGDGMPSLESANVILRRELDLFANVRPIKIEKEGIDWVFFRENTEGSYTLGSKGLNIDDKLFVDFTISTSMGSERIARIAFDYAKKTGKKRVTIITKANIIKTTDGSFLEICKNVAKDYDGITVDDLYVDIAAAKLIDSKARKDLSVFILPNLYGDILTDEAAQIQGGVGTAGSANIGKRYAMFEAVHGSAPQMVEQGLTSFANPTSILRAAALMLNHIGFTKKAQKLDDALDKAAKEESEIKMTGFKGGSTLDEFLEFIVKRLD